MPALGTIACRITALGFSVACAGLAGATYVYYAGAAGLGALDLALAATITLATAWIAWGAAQGLIGIVLPRPCAPSHGGAISSRTCILVPVYNEDPEAVFARIMAMNDDLVRERATAHFDIAILSDTRDARIAAREEALLPGLLARTGGTGRVFYRRRTDNTGRKAGNIEDFIRSAGGAYDFVLILDADSLMTAETMVEMVRRMETDPELGLLQSLPRVIGASSRFGRMIQFSAAFYAPVYCNGLGWLAGRTGSFWGHNALVRTRAFAESCGLSVLRGKPPFGGHVLSHDSVEAALLARGGWTVRVDSDLTGSFEEGPEDLIAYAKRDRRWAQGNLQHSRVLGAPGLKPWSRVHLALGIVSYIAPAVWAAYLLLSLAVASTEDAINYFPVSNFPVPAFPGERTAAAVGLFVGVIGLLFVSKAVLLAHALVSGRANGFGGLAATTASTLREVLLSSILSPVLMLFQMRALWEILSGRDGGWPSATREATAVPLTAALQASWWMSAVGATGLVWALIVSPAMAAWLLPVALPMLAAPLLIAWTSEPGRRDILVTPPELREVPVIAGFHAARAEIESAPAPMAAAAGQ